MIRLWLALLVLLLAFGSAYPTWGEQGEEIIAEVFGPCEVPFLPSIHIAWVDTDGNKDKAEKAIISVLLPEGKQVVAVVEGSFPDTGEWTMTAAHVKTLQGEKHYDSREKFLEDWPTPCDLWRANQPPVPA